MDGRAVCTEITVRLKSISVFFCFSQQSVCILCAYVLSFIRNQWLAVVMYKCVCVWFYFPTVFFILFCVVINTSQFIRRTDCFTHIYFNGFWLLWKKIRPICFYFSTWNTLIPWHIRIQIYEMYVSLLVLDTETLNEFVSICVFFDYFCASFETMTEIRSFKTKTDKNQFSFALLKLMS